MDVEKDNEDFYDEYDDPFISDEPFWVWDPFPFRVVNPEVQILGNIIDRGILKDVNGTKPGGTT